MTLALDNRNSPESIQVNIKFKLSPKMFEVVLAGMSEKSDLGEIPTSFDYRRQQEILKDFWITCHSIWQDIYQQIPHLPKDTQISFANLGDL
jgi:hypothetical protein